MGAAGAHLYLWRGCALVVGPGIDSKLHNHFATQLTVALDQPFHARFAEDEAWVETRAATFAPNQQHQIDSSGLLAHIFVESAQQGRVTRSELREKYADDALFEGVKTALQLSCSGALGMDAAEQMVQAWLACALPDDGTTAGFDPRIAKTLDWLAQQSHQDWSGEELAARAHLSTSRFTHLFRQQTGLPLTRYLLWNRLLTAVAAVAEGANTTEAAYEAGFADLAHMSRTFRQTFGVMPSELQKMTIAFKRDGHARVNIRE